MNRRRDFSESLGGTSLLTALVILAILAWGMVL